MTQKFALHLLLSPPFFIFSKKQIVKHKTKHEQLWGGKGGPMCVHINKWRGRLLCNVGKFKRIPVFDTQISAQSLGPSELKNQQDLAIPNYLYLAVTQSIYKYSKER
jgi:hypothetical protein